MSPIPGATVWGYASSDEAERWDGAYPTREQAIAAGAETDPAGLAREVGAFLAEPRERWYT